jgi:hypothetical protein
MTITPSEEMQPIVIELKPEKPVTKKIVLKGVEVHIAEETKIILTADGRTLTDAEYVEYPKEEVTSRVATLSDFYKIWTELRVEENSWRN